MLGLLLLSNGVKKTGESLRDEAALLFFISNPHHRKYINLHYIAHNMTTLHIYYKS